MKRIKNFLKSLGILLLLVGGLVAWTMLPWYGVLAAAVLLLAWLLLTRSGALALACRSVGAPRR